MKIWPIALLLAATSLSASFAAAAQSPPAACSATTYRSIEQQVRTTDPQGHGPDVSSDEWQSAVEFRLGIRGKGDVPPRGTEAWCRHVDGLARLGPSFSCARAETGSIEALVCGDAQLSALDRRLAGVFAAASARAVNEQPPVLKAEQRGWIKGRDDCWKSDDRRSCALTEYQRRIAELEARYRLVAGTGPVRFTCDGDTRNELVATFFPTEPPTLIAERGDSVSLMYLEPSASGSRYQGRNESFWEHQGEATVTWGYGTPGMRCRKAPRR
jgi:uncharacterized protein